MSSKQIEALAVINSIPVIAKIKNSGRLSNLYSRLANQIIQTLRPMVFSGFNSPLMQKKIGDKLVKFVDAVGIEGKAVDVVTIVNLAILLAEKYNFSKEHKILLDIFDYFDRDNQAAEVCNYGGEQLFEIWESL